MTKPKGPMAQPGDNARTVAREFFRAHGNPHKLLMTQEDLAAFTQWIVDTAMDGLRQLVEEHRQKDRGVIQ